MAVILNKSQGSGYSLSYEELARVHQAAMQGNTAAAIRLAQLPQTEQRLGAELVKVFKPKKRKTITKAQKQAVKAQSPAQLALYSLLDSDNPADRETARKLLGG